jgi:hypothetical protein
VRTAFSDVVHAHDVGCERSRDTRLRHELGKHDLDGDFPSRHSIESGMDTAQVSHRTTYGDHLATESPALG